MPAGFTNGALVEGAGETISVQSPSTEDEIARFAGMSLAQVDQAIASARTAFDRGGWRDIPTTERVGVLARFIAALAARKDAIVELIMNEAGCPKATIAMNSQVAVPLGQGPEILSLFESLPQTEENPLPLAQRITAMGTTIQSHRRYTPIGVVSAVAAYNFPFLTALWKVIPALVTGNTVVLRPSPFTPLSALPFAEAAMEAGLPPGVLNIVLEAGLEGGQLMTTHADVDMVAFTGSSAVGARIMAQAAPTMKRIQLELGGKSAQVFLPDMADRAAQIAAGAATSHAGQGCAIGTRIFVPQEKKAEALAQMEAIFSKIRVGRADDPQTQLGPVISAAQRARCEHFVQAATEAGGRLVVGGRRPAHLDKGFFYEATVIDAPDNKNPSAQEEIFGPVITVIGYRDLDHAVEMANDSKFGLSGYVFGQDKKEAFRVGMGIRSGTVNVNAGLMSSYISSGGQRMSGLGRERGVEGLRLYQQMSVLNLG